MKILFVGEGDHDIGGASETGGDRAPNGVVPTLAHRVCPNINLRDGSASKSWQSIPVLLKDRSPGSTRYRKARNAVTYSHSQGFDGTVVVIDRDRDENKAQEIRDGLNRGAQLAGDGHLVAGGVAVESIEAWTLGAPTAICQELNVSVKQLMSVYKPARVERDLYANSKKPAKNSKSVLRKVCELGNQTPTADFRRRVAAVTDVAELERNCPEGFAQFANELLKAFGPKSAK